MLNIVIVPVEISDFSVQMELAQASYWMDRYEIALYSRRESK